MGQDVQSRASPDRRPSLDAYRGIGLPARLLRSLGTQAASRQDRLLCYNGVHLFFVLSSYLLGGKLLERRSVGDKSWTISVYLRRRFLRIYPAYSCACAVGLHFNCLDMTDLFAIHAALWTLAVEIQFYLFLPMASLLVLLL